MCCDVYIRMRCMCVSQGGEGAAVAQGTGKRAEKRGGSVKKRLLSMKQGCKRGTHTHSYMPEEDCLRYVAA